jgi:hypothetical protein
MKIKTSFSTRNTEFDGIVIEFKPGEKKQLIKALISTDKDKVCIYPDEWDRSTVEEWMSSVGELEK